MMLKLLSTLNVVSGRDSDDAHIFSVSAPVPVLRPAHPHHAAARDPGCRKSFLLLQAMHHALSANWIMLYIPRCGWDLWMHVCQASLGIVDEVGASLPGRSVGPLWRFRHVQIHTGNL